MRWESMSGKKVLFYWAVIWIIIWGAALLLVSSAHSAPNKPWQYRYTVFMEPHQIRLAACESGHNPPQWTHHDYYEGAFGFAPSTWRGYKLPSYPAHAYDANPYQQWRVAGRVAHATGGLRFPWGCWRGSEHAWVRGNVPYNAVW